MKKILEGIFLIFFAVSGSLTLMGFFGRFGWLFDLASYFRMQYFLIQFLCAIFFVFLGRWEAFTAALVLIGLNFILIVPFYVHSFDKPVKTETGFGKVKILSLNVNTAIKDYQRLLDYIRKTDPDILALDEINKTWFDTLSKDLIGYKFARFSDCGECDGIGVLSKRIPSQDRTEYYSGVKIPAMKLVFKNSSQDFALMFTHSICPDKAAYFDQRNRHLSELAVSLKHVGRDFVLIGDLNTGPWSCYYEKFLAQTGLRDGRLGFGALATWRANFFLSAMIDQCLVGEGVVILNYIVGPDIGSDHYPLYCEIGMARV